MPELPEVECLRRSLIPHLDGLEFGRLEILNHSPLQIHLNATGSATAQLQQRLQGARLLRLDRLGKYLLWTLQCRNGQPLYCHMHLRMTGRCLFCPAPETTPHSPQGTEPHSKRPLYLPPHTHLIFELCNEHGQTKAFLLWQDVRRFGRLAFYDDTTHTAALNALRAKGRDALDPALTPRELFDSAQNSRLSIAAFLLDQNKIMGLGNIYVQELLFTCHLRPDSPASRLSLRRWTQILGACRELLERAIQAGGSSISDYLDADGRAGSFSLQHRVYGHYGKPCPVCGTELKRYNCAGRHLCYCPNCQKLPRRRTRPHAQSCLTNGRSKH